MMLMGASQIGRGFYNSAQQTVVACIPTTRYVIVPPPSPQVSASGVHVGVVQPGLVKSSLMERSTFYGKDSEEDRR